MSVVEKCSNDDTFDKLVFKRHNSWATISEMASRKKNPWKLKRLFLSISKQKLWCLLSRHFPSELFFGRSLEDCADNCTISGLDVTCVKKHFDSFLENANFQEVELFSPLKPGWKPEKCLTLHNSKNSCYIPRWKSALGMYFFFRENIWVRLLTHH